MSETSKVRELLWAADAVVDIREELRLAEGLPPGRVLYIDRLFRELDEARLALASTEEQA